MKKLLFCLFFVGLPVMLFAQQGDSSEKLYQEGKFYYDTENNTKAVELFRKAADQESVCGYYQLGMFYSESMCESYLDDEKAMKWFRKALEGGDERAQMFLDALENPVIYHPF